jgi:hypothetical protein
MTSASTAAVSFWGEQLHCTMIDGGDRLWSCRRFIELNMVHARIVGHPREWARCGYQELVAGRERFRLLEIDRLHGVVALHYLG